MVVYLISPYISPAPSVLLFLGAMSAAAYAVAKRGLKTDALKPYVQGKKTVLLVLVCLYASFASFGYRLFLAGAYMNFSIDRLIYLILGAIWFFPVIIMLLAILEWAGSRYTVPRVINSETGKKRGGLRVGLISGFIFLLCISIGYIGFYPGGFPWDANEQFTQAITGTYNNWHPVVHTLIIKLFLTILNKPGFVVFAQIVLLAMLVGRVAIIPYGFGVKPAAIYICSAIFALLPNQAMTNISPLKDFMFSYALLWGTVLLFELAMDIAKIHKIRYMAELIVCMYLIKELRHNGIIPLEFICVLLIVLTVKYWKQVKLKATVCIALSIALIGITEGPVFKMLNVIPNAVSPYVTMFCAVGSCINKGKTLSDETMKKLEKVMSVEDWAQYYGRFVGHDHYIWREGETRAMDLSQFSAREAFSIYLEALLKYPDIVIKDRLDGMNIMWDVTQPDDEDSFNYRTFTMIVVDDSIGLDVEGVSNGQYYYIHNDITDAYYGLSAFALPGERTEDQLSDMLLWRSGAYLIFFTILALFWIKNRLHRMWWATMPFLGNIAAMMLVLYHQSFRYVYFIQLLVVALALMTFYMHTNINDKLNDRG